MENQNLLIEMWNTHKRSNRTSSVVEGWNSKLNSTAANQQPGVFSAGTEMKSESTGRSLVTEVEGT